MPGPAPKANPRRRNARPDTVLLPPEGYQGEVPEWPLTKASRAEADAWGKLWRLPQAEAWAAMNLARTVARYVRALIPAEKPGAPAFKLSEVRQLEDRLGLTPMAMLRLRWEVAPVAELEEEPEDEAPVADVRRLFAV